MANKSLFFSQSISLPLPWGNCTNKFISFFEGESYTRSKCKLNHETESLINMCGCKDIQMPGRTFFVSYHRVSHNIKLYRYQIFGTEYSIKQQNLHCRYAFFVMRRHFADIET